MPRAKEDGRGHSGRGGEAGHGGGKADENDKRNPIHPTAEEEGGADIEEQNHGDGIGEEVGHQQGHRHQNHQNA